MAQGILSAAEIAPKTYPDSVLQRYFTDFFKERNKSWIYMHAAGRHLCASMENKSSECPP